MQCTETPNSGVNRSAKQRCCLVPAALRASAPGYAERLGSPKLWAAIGELEGMLQPYIKRKGGFNEEHEATSVRGRC